MRGAQLRENGKWMAQIKINGVQTYLGLYDTEAEASAAWHAARASHPRAKMGAKRANQRRGEEAETRQMARCEAMLAAEEIAKQPERARCECGGILARGHTHEHQCRYRRVA